MKIVEQIKTYEYITGDISMRIYQDGLKALPWMVFYNE
jgi:hypothetical protein